MDDIHNLDVDVDRESTVPIGRQESKVPRSPWYKPVLRRSDIALYTGYATRGTPPDGGSGYS